MKLNNRAPETNGLQNKPKGFSSLRNQLMIALTALGIAGYAAGDMFTTTPSQDKHVQNITKVPSKDLSSANTVALFPNKETADYNKDSLNQIIESKITAIQKQRENEFLQKKFVAYQKDVKENINAFKSDKIFQKEKQEELSDQQLHTYSKDVVSAKDLSDLSSVCDKIISYINKLLDKKDVTIDGKTLKTKNVKDSEFFLKLNDYKEAFQDLMTEINNVHFEPETFKNVQPNADVVKYTSAIDSLKKEIAAGQSDLGKMQDSLIILYKELNDSTDAKIEEELANESAKVNYAQFKNNSIISDTDLLKQKHDMEQLENKRKNHIAELVTSIFNQNKTILNIEEHKIPDLNQNIDTLYSKYGEVLDLLINAIRNQHTDIMVQKDTLISSQLGGFKQLIKNIYARIDTLEQKHQSVLSDITIEKEKIHLSDSSKINDLLAKYQAEENNLAQTYKETNAELIDKNIELGNMLSENYDVYLDMLEKCKIPLSGYFTDLEKEITSLDSTISKLQKGYEANQLEILKLSKSDDAKDVNTCQKKIKDNQICKEKISDGNKEKQEKINTKEDIQNEINEINNVEQYIKNNKDLTMFGMKIYLAAKQIQATEAQLKAAQEIKKSYESLLVEKNTALTNIMTKLASVNADIQKLNAKSDADNYASLSKLMEQKDSLLLNKKALEGDVQNVSGKNDAKGREISRLEKTLTDLADFGNDELKKREGLIYNRDQSFNKTTNKSKYYKEDLIRSPEDILDDVPTIVKTIKTAK